MPSGKVHRMDSRLGGYSGKVNDLIDLPYAWLGNKHRVFFHDPISVMLIGMMLDGPQGVVGGLRHRALDNIKDRDVKAQLEFMAAIPQRKGKAIRVVSSRT